jgi:hypothetical protein
MSSVIGAPDEETFQCMLCFNYVFRSKLWQCPECQFAYCSKCKEKIGEYCTICTEAHQRDSKLIPLVVLQKLKTYNSDEIKDDVYKLKE